MPQEVNIEKGFAVQRHILDLMNQQYKGTEYSAEGSSSYEDKVYKFDIKILKNGKTVDKIDVKTCINDTGNISYTVVNQKGGISKAASGDTSVRLGFVFKGESKMYLVDMNEFCKFLQSAELHEGTTTVKIQEKDTATYPNVVKKDDSKVTAWNYYNVHRDTDGPVEGINYYAVHMGQLKPIYKKIYGDKSTWYFENGSKYVLLSRKDAEDMCKVGNGKIVDCSKEMVLPISEMTEDSSLDLSGV